MNQPVLIDLADIGISQAPLPTWTLIFAFGGTGQIQWTSTVKCRIKQISTTTTAVYVTTFDRSSDLTDVVAGRVSGTEGGFLCGRIAGGTEHGQVDISHFMNPNDIIYVQNVGGTTAYVNVVLELLPT